MVTDTISWFELIWSIAALVGLVFNTKILFAATTDLFYLRYRRINSIREYAAMTTVYAFGSAALVQLGYFIVGVNAMTANDPMHHTAKQAVTLVVFVFTSVTLSSMAIIIERRRNILKKKLEEAEDFGH